MMSDRDASILSSKTDDKHSVENLRRKVPVPTSDDTIRDIRSLTKMLRVTEQPNTPYERSTDLSIAQLGSSLSRARVHSDHKKSHDIGKIPTVSAYLNRPEVLMKLAVDSGVAAKPTAEELQHADSQARIDRQINMLLMKGQKRAISTAACAPIVPPRDPMVLENVLPVLGSMSPRSRKRLRELPLPNDYEAKKAVEYETRFLHEDLRLGRKDPAGLYALLHSAAKPRRKIEYSPTSILPSLPREKKAINHAVEEMTRRTARPDPIRCPKSGNVLSLARDEVRGKSPRGVKRLHYNATRCIAEPGQLQPCIAEPDQYVTGLLEVEEELLGSMRRSEEASVGIVDKEMEIIANIRRWLPTELLFEQNKAKYVFQNGAVRISEVMRRFINSLQYNALQQWRRVVVVLRVEHQIACCIIIQRVFRGYAARKAVMALRRLVVEQVAREARRVAKLATIRRQSAISIQRMWKGFGARKEFKQFKLRVNAAVRIQCSYRIRRSKLLLVVLRTVALARLSAAINIQRVYRGHQARRKACMLSKIRNFERKQIALSQRRGVVRAQFRREGAALLLQRWYRSRTMLKFTRRRVRARKFMAALKIQQAWRGFKARKLLRELRETAKAVADLNNRAATRLQTAWRRRAGVKLLSNMREQLQKARDERKAKREFAKKDKYVPVPRILKALPGMRKGINLSAIRRGLYRGARFLDPFLASREKSAALTVQRMYRGARARKRMREQLLSNRIKSRKQRKDIRLTATIKLQTAWRTKVARRLVTSMRVNKASARIQGLYRGWRDRRLVREMRRLYLAALRIQRQYKRRLARTMVKALRVRRKLEASNCLPIQRVAKQWHDLRVVEFIREHRRVYAEIKLMGRAELDVAKVHLRDRFLLDGAFAKVRKQIPAEAGLQGLWLELSYSAKRKVASPKLGPSGGVSGMNWARFIKECPGLTDKQLNSVRIDIIFSKCVAAGKKELGFAEFVAALMQVAAIKFPSTAFCRRVAVPEHAKLVVLCYEFIFQKGFKTSQSAREGLTAWVDGHVAKQASIIQARFRGNVCRNIFQVLRASHAVAIEAKRQEAAVTLIQKLVRRRLARKEFIVMMQTVWNKFLDPATGECYYFNPRTGTKSWYKPKLLGRHDVVAVTRLPDKVMEYVVKCVYCEIKTAIYVCDQCEDPVCEQCFMENHIRGKRALHTKTLLPFCSECRYQTATRTCPACPVASNHFCDICFPNRHQPGLPPINGSLTGVSHKEEPIVVLCIECETLAARWYCNDCNDNFCTGCFSAIHAKGHKTMHNYRQQPYFSIAMRNRRAAVREAAAKTAEQEIEARLSASRQREREVWAATMVQKTWRGRHGRLQGKKVLKTERRKIRRKWRQRKLDNVVRSTVAYKIADVFGLAKKLDSDSLEETAIKSLPAWRRGVVPEKDFKRLPGSVTVAQDSHFAITTNDLTARLERGQKLWIGSAAKGREFKVHATLPISADRIPLEPKWALDPIEDAPIYDIPPPRSGWLQVAGTIKESSAGKSLVKSKAAVANSLAIATSKAASKLRVRFVSKLASRMELQAKQLRYDVGSAMTEKAMAKAWRVSVDEGTGVTIYSNSITEESTTVKPEAVRLREQRELAMAEGKAREEEEVRLADAQAKAASAKARLDMKRKGMKR